MNNSTFWARTLGLYAVILSIWSFLNIKHIGSLMDALASNTSLSMLLGLFTVFLGLVMIISHSVWKGWPILVTILGYWITLKGMVILFFPEWINKIIAVWHGKNMIYAPIPALVIGLLLLYFGFFCRKS